MLLHLIHLFTQVESMPCVCSGWPHGRAMARAGGVKRRESCVVSQPLTLLGTIQIGLTIKLILINFVPMKILPDVVADRLIVSPRVRLSNLTN